MGSTGRAGPLQSRSPRPGCPGPGVDGLGNQDRGVQDTRRHLERSEESWAAQPSARGGAPPGLRGRPGSVCCLSLEKPGHGSPSGWFPV